MARKKDSPRAKAWDKLSGRTAEETIATRDVYEQQQLDRSKIQAKQSKTSRTIVAVVFGAFIMVILWGVWSLGHFAVDQASGAMSGLTSTSSPYYEKEKVSTTRYCYRLLDADGQPDKSTPCYDSEAEAKENPPKWFLEEQEQQEAERAAADAAKPEGLTGYLAYFSLLKLLVSLGGGFLSFAILYPFLMRNLDAQNLMHDTTDINQYQGDQHVAIPDEVVRKFDWFPDVGAHSDVQPSSMISHVMLSNKGLKKIQVSEIADADVIDEQGNQVCLKGEILRLDDGSPKTKTVPVIDEAFGEDLFEASGLPKDKKLRRRFVASEIEYNADGSNREKLGKFKTVADLINEDWTFPEYEVQRPAGAYIVDTAPVNTMVLAITRAGKGQTYIEPMLDMWLRERRPNNMVVNDPKGELLVKHYVRATMRGFQVVQFNLINSMKTDIYNPLGMAAEAAREGDATKCALYIENIADVFFPLDGGEDPVWPSAANNAFKRAAYGLIDYYLEEERELRAYAARVDMDPKVLENKLDEKWGKVTLYNCYQLFVQLTAKKAKNPVKALEERAKNGEFGDPQGEDFDDDAYEEERIAAQRKAFLWEDKPELDMLTLFFNATGAMPQNSMRTLVSNADNALRAMGAAEKMLASVYGIAITAMSFFTDPTISTLTSGTPSQNTDLGGLSFPRRMGVRFGMNFLKKNNLIGSQAKWEAFDDDSFDTPLGKDFYHEDIVSREGWARYYFKGKFAGEVAYLRLRLVNPQTGMLIRTFYFKFTKDYQTNLTGRFFVTDPISGEKIVKNGILVEVKPQKDEQGQVTGYKPGHTTYKQMRLTNVTMAQPDKEMTDVNAIIQTMVRYSEQPKAVFLVTPPHLMKYAKLVLILVKQLVDLNFDKSYMTKENQKPLYKTRFMLDELGNLQSEGHGISGFETMLSIGLGQEQQFTLILQTLQQLRDVYGESVDKIVQGNASHLRSLIATPKGWQTMGETKVGDVILTPFGDRTEVTGVFPKGTRPVYRVTLRDGSSSEVCEQHLWPVERWKSAIRYLGGKGPDGKRLYEGTGPGGATSVRVSEVIDTLELKRRVDARKQVDLPRIEPLDYDERDLPVDPYVLGVVLGDGHIRKDNGFVQMTKQDRFIIDELGRRGQAVSNYGLDANGLQRYGLLGLGERMRSLGLAGKRSWEKSIPTEYLYGSVEQRLDLLRGLMDTDGTISTTGEMEFISTSRALAEGVQALVRSLGGRVSVNVKTGVRYTSSTQSEPKEARDAYRVQNIRLPKINPFLLPRKAERWVERDDNSGNRVVSVEYVRDEPVQCISVADERHLYVMDDYMPTHNTSNIVFLKSTDDSMIETLEKMSGKRHVVYRDSKTVTKDMERVIKLGNVEGKVSYTMNTKEEPVISYNDMAFISERQSVVFRAGDSPVWNRNETILPMSWRLYQNDIVDPGKDYSLQTIPTLSSALEFDVRMNQPDFDKMLAKRMRQAELAEDCKALYRNAFDYKEVDIARLDPDVYSDEVMELVDAAMRENVAEEQGFETPDDVDPEALEGSIDFGESWEEDMEMQQAIAAEQAKMERFESKIYASKQISRSMLVNPNGGALLKALDAEIVEAYKAVRPDLERDADNFSVGGDGSLRSRDGQTVYISRQDESEAMRRLKEASEDEDTRVYSEDEIQDLTGYQVHPEFYEFLASLDSWVDLARGEFDRAMARAMRSMRAGESGPEEAAA